MNKEYKITPNPAVAFSMKYTEGSDVLFFTIEVGEDDSCVYINRNPSNGASMINMKDPKENARVSRATERMLEYFQAQGKRAELE